MHRQSATTTAGSAYVLVRDDRYGHCQLPTSASVCVTGETDRPIDRSIDGLIGRVMDHPIDRLIHGPTGGLIHGLINRRAVPLPWGLLPFRPVTLRPCLSTGLPFVGIEVRTIAQAMRPEV